MSFTPPHRLWHKSVPNPVIENFDVNVMIGLRIYSSSNVFRQITTHGGRKFPSAAMHAVNGMCVTVCDTG
jgi:hypothetical protein